MAGRPARIGGRTPPAGLRSSAMTSSNDPWTWHATWELYLHAERLSRPFALRRADQARPVWEPPIDVFESQEGYHVVVALPGVDAGDVEVGLSGQALVVVGQRTRPRACAHLKVRRLEIPHGRFERRIELPPGRYRLASREMVDGCLVVAFERM